MIVYIYRITTNKNQSLGYCVIKEKGLILFESRSLERGWLDNQKNVSCVPAATYNAVVEYSPKFNRDLWELKGVPGRSECKFHAANYWNQLNGCIALGKEFKDINNDNFTDITESRETMECFHQVLRNYKTVKVEIIDLFN